MGVLFLFLRVAAACECGKIFSDNVSQPLASTVLYVLESLHYTLLQKLLPVPPDILHSRVTVFLTYGIAELY